MASPEQGGEHVRHNILNSPAFYLGNNDAQVERIEKLTEEIVDGSASPEDAIETLTEALDEEIGWKTPAERLEWIAEGLVNRELRSRGLKPEA